MSDERLPEFERPPVSEVAVGLQFLPLPIRAIDLAPLRSTWTADYPVEEEQPALPPAAEVPASPITPTINFGPMPMNRHWWVSADQARVLQVQADRFIVNWRRTDDDASYPHYAQLKAEFDKRFQELSDLLAAPSEPLRVTHAELTYINAVPLSGSAAEDLLRWTPPNLPAFGAPNHWQWAQSFTFADNAGRPGQLVVSYEPQTREDGEQFMFLNLVARGFVEGVASEGPSQFLDAAHAAIVTAFDQLTTPEAHQRWGRA